MRRILLRSMILITLSGLTSITAVGWKSSAYAATETLDTEVTQILIEEAAHGKIKVGILDFAVSFVDAGKKLPESASKELGTQVSEEFSASLINKIKDAGKRDVISIIERNRLDEILKEKKYR